MTTDAMSVTTQHNQVGQPNAVQDKRSEIASVPKGLAWGKSPPSSSAASATVTIAAITPQDEPSSPVHQKAYASSTDNKESFKENISPRLEAASAATTNGKFVEAPVPRVNPWKVRQNQSQVSKSPQMPPRQHSISTSSTTTSSPAPSHSVWSTAHDSNTKSNSNDNNTNVNNNGPSNTTASSPTKGASVPSPLLKAGASSSVAPNPPIALNDTESWPTPADDFVKEKKQAETVSTSSTSTKTTKKPEWIKYEGAEIVYNTPAAGKSARGGNGGSGSGGGDRKGYKRSGANRSGSREAESNDGGKTGAGVAGKHRRAQSVSGGVRSNSSPAGQGKQLNKAEQPPVETGASSTAVDSVAPDAKIDTQQLPSATKLNSTTNESVVQKNGVSAKDVHAKQQLSSVPTTPSDRSSSPGNKHPNIQFGTIDASSSTTSASVINGPQMSGTHQHSQRSNLRSDKVSRNTTTNSGTIGNSGTNQSNGVTYRPNARSQSLSQQFFQNPTSAQGAAGGVPIQYPLQPPFASQPMYGSLPPRAHSMSMYGYPAPGMSPMPPLMDMASMQMALSQMGYYEVMASRDIILRQM